MSASAVAVDFSLLPQEEGSQDKAPSRFVWTIAFFVMMLGCVFAILLLWPKGMPTQTLKFWISLVLFPVGIPTFVVLRRYSVYEGRKLDTALNNEAIHTFNKRVFEAASIPFAMLGCAHRISSDPKENAPDRIKRGAVTLKAKDPLAKQGQVAKTRWLDVPGMPSAPGGKARDLRRRQYVTAWLFNQLIEELRPCIRSLPDRAPIMLRLSIANGFTRKENEQLWRTYWDRGISRYIEVLPSSEMPTDLMMLDHWMDAALKSEAMHITLLVVVQLHPLLTKTPPEGVTEAGVAVVLAPEALARQYAIPCLCHLHRPVRAEVDQPQEALIHALRWADVAAEHVNSAWQTGLNATQTSCLHEPARKLGLSVQPTDLNQTAGDAGIAAPWLALACAASSLTDTAAEQMLLVGQDKHLDCAVVKHVPSEARSRNSRSQASHPLGTLEIESAGGNVVQPQAMSRVVRDAASTTAKPND